jgi:DNA modification methylase
MLNNQKMRARQRLASLLAGDLSFHAPARLAHPLYALHPFAARFPHGLPGYFIDTLTEAGDTVLDPMCGSGITLLEGWAAGRSVVGVDLDPLARRQAAARTTALCDVTVREAGHAALRRTADLIAGLGSYPDPLEAVKADMDPPTREFLDYWFFPQTQQELACLTLAIREEPDPDLRNLLEIVFSSTIVTKSGGVSRARDLAHTRPHRVADKVPRRPIPVFANLVERAAYAYANIDRDALGDRRIFAGDARALPLSDSTADLIVTSPPYANALDYMRAHKFSLAWLGDPIPSLTQLRGKYIGSESAGSAADASSGDELPATVETVVERVAAVDTLKSRILRRYFVDMSASIAEMERVLRPGSAAVIVVGPSTMRGILVPTHECLADLATQAGLHVVKVSPRQLDRDRRMMPARSAGRAGVASTAAMGIERRMHTEYIIGAVKA